jgi:hypothetical protein
MHYWLGSYRCELPGLPLLADASLRKNALYGAGAATKPLRENGVEQPSLGFLLAPDQRVRTELSNYGQRSLREVKSLAPPTAVFLGGEQLGQIAEAKQFLHPGRQVYQFQSAVAFFGC